MTGREKQPVRGRRDVPSRDLESLSGSETGSSPTISPEEREVLNAKMFLMSTNDPEEPSLYEHMSKLIAEILDKKHTDTMTLFDHISRFLKMERIHIPTLSLRNHVQQTHSGTLANAQWNLLEKSKRITVAQALEAKLDDETEEQKFQGVPDVMRNALYFEMAGVGLPREEFVRISLALSDLANAYPSIQHIRFWGKLFGTQKNYYVAETELSDHELEDDVDMYDGVHSIINKTHEENVDLNLDFGEEDSTLFDDVILPEDLKPMYKPPPKIPCEPAGTGLNRKVYFVTYEPGLTWTRLPHVTPAQIQVARKIRKLLTGDLESHVVSFPPFPGVERNYVRAQIARISASTHVSPLGYFRFDDEGEEEEEALGEEAGGRGNIIVDTEFEGMAIKDLADGSLQAWVHHSPAVLPQGRTTWWNPVQPKEEFNEEGDSEGEEEERQEPDEPEPEIGPPLLCPLGEDESIGFSPAWFASTSSKFVPEYSIAVLQSNVWIGAAAFATEKGKFFENIYIGWGLKNLANDFEPALPDNPLDEFPSGQEITEADDPTPEEEAAVRAAQQEKELEAEFEQNVQDDDDDDGIVDDDGEGGDQFDED